MLRRLDWVASAAGGLLIGSANGASLVIAKTDLEVGSVEVDLALAATDSRNCSPGSIYFARVGENSDGHNYVESAVQNGASAVVVERELEDIHVPQILVDDSTIALGRIAKAHLADLRKNQNLTVIGITGSAGKTTTKDLLARVLGAFGATVAPVLSFNNEVGCPLTILRSDGLTRYLVLEMGASGSGHIAYLTSIAPLDVAVVLMVGRAHLGGFGSESALAEAKSELVQGLLPGGTAVLNRDDLLVWEMRSKAPASTVGFSVSGSHDSLVRANDIQLDDVARARFVAQIGSLSRAIHLTLIGRHQVSNALAVLAVVYALGLDAEIAARVIEESQADSPHRMDVRTVPLPGNQQGASFTLIDDSYNANPDSMNAAFKAASALAREDSQILMVLGEMLELGDESAIIHREVGDSALSIKPASIIELGSKNTYVGDTSPSEVELLTAVDPEEAHRLLMERLREGSIVLIKGSYGSQSWKVADKMLELVGGLDRIVNEKREGV